MMPVSWMDQRCIGNKTEAQVKSYSYDFSMKDYIASSLTIPTLG